MNLITIFQGTPYWVWGVFTYLLIIGIRATKPHTAYLARLGIVPAIFILWSIFSINSKYGLSLQTVGICCLFWLLSLVTVIMLYTIYKPALSIDKKSLIVTMQGSYLPLTLSLVFFSVKYILGATYAINPAMQLTPLCKVISP